MYYKSIVTLAFLLTTSASCSLYACDKTPYKIGVQAIDYTPHYNGDNSDQDTFFKYFMQWLSAATGCRFDIVSLPIKRLDLEFESHSLDFIYPDNPKWQKNNQSRFYSPPLTTALGGTMVKPENKDIALTSFHTLVFPRGFSPVAWYPLQKRYAIDFKEVSTPAAALLMVNADRATGADIEFNVAQHLMAKHNFAPLVIAKNLPFTPTGFHLATIKHHELMTTITQLIERHPEALISMRKKAGLTEKLP